MCDCFHLAFPNWHASATGDGRRLKGPEQDTDDDLACEEPEVLEEERPRPQGSSPVEEFPTTEKYVKQAEGDFYDSPTKSSKKGKRIGFGSLFDKRSSAKMNQTEEMQNDESEIIVKTTKEVCAEGLVVRGGGNDGIFIKELKPESPASKHLNVNEGDQILSATVYFDNVSYEDALQILEHAQPYKVEFCLKRKPVPTRIQEDDESMKPDVIIGEEAEGEESSEPEMRDRRKTKKQQDRISWPKCPSFSKGRRANFKRSHSTSEAEERRKLEISPLTSDTESPIKSPLKSPDGKEKKKMHKMKLKMRMTGRRSKSVEETPENGEELTTENMEVLENQMFVNIAEEHSFQEPVINLVESPKLLDEADKAEPTKTRNEYTTLPLTESLHKVELISLDNTLKTTDITVALGEDSKERRERSELKVSIQGMDQSELGTESQLKSVLSGMRTSDPSTSSPNLILQREEVGHQVDSDSMLIYKEILEKTQGQEDIDMSIPKADVSLDISDVDLMQKSPRIGSDKEKKERNVLETESYGIRTRGPLADIAASKSPFTKTVNRLEFTSSDSFTFEIKTMQDVSSTDMGTKKSSSLTPVLFQPKPNALDVDKSRKSPGSTAQVIKTSELTEMSNIDLNLTDLGIKSESKFKLPKVDISEFDYHESIIIRQKDPTKAPLLKREEIEIPGMEDKGSKANLQSPRMKEPKIEKIIQISKVQGEVEEFNVEDVKEAVSKFPAFKLPERDITGVLVQREIKIKEMKTDKTGMTPKGSPCKISTLSTEISSKLTENTVDKEKSPTFVTRDEAFILPNIEHLHLHEETRITEKKIDKSLAKFEAQQSKTGKMLARDDKISTSPFKLPKREDIEIPGMEAIEQSVQVQKIKVAKDTQDDAIKDYTDAYITGRSAIKVVKKGHEKKSKKAKESMPSFGIMKPDIRFPDIGIELPENATSSKSDEMKEMKAEAKISLDETKQKKTSQNEARVAIKQSAEETTFKKSQEGDVKGDQILHHDKSAVMTTPKQEVTQQMASTNEGEPKAAACEPSLAKAEIKNKDTNTDVSPHKMKLPKFKMPKIGGKSIKESTETTIKDDVTMQENDTIEVELDSEKRTSENDTKAQSFEIHFSKIKMPSLDISLPKVKIPKSEGKTRQEETGLSKPEIDAGVEFNKDHITSETPGPTKERVGKADMKVKAVEGAQEESGCRMIKIGKISLPKEMTEQCGLLPDETILSEGNTIKFDGKTEVESSELPQIEIKETESKLKKRKISFPKFGFSKSEKSDADITLSTLHSSFQEGGADVTEQDVQSKTTEAEAELKDSTDSPTKCKLPTIKLPKCVVSFPKATDAGTDIQMPGVSREVTTMDVTFPEAKLSGELTAPPDINVSETILSVSKPDDEMSISEGKLEITDTDIPKVDEVSIKPSPELSFSKSEVQASLTEGNMEIKAPNAAFNISKGDAEQKDLTIGSAPVKFKLPSINLPKFGGKASKVVKDMPIVDIDAEDPDVRLPEEQRSMKLKDVAPSGDINESYMTTECVSVDVKVEDAKPKGQENMVKQQKFGISLSEVKAPHTDFSTPKKEGDITSVDAKTEVRSSFDDVPTDTFDKPEDYSKGPNVKLKRPSYSLPKFGFSKPDVKASETDLSLPKVDVSKLTGCMDKEELTVDTKESTDEADQTEKVSRGSPTKFKLPTIKFPKFGVSFQKTTGSDLDKQMPEVTKDKPTMEIELPEAEMSGELPSVPEMKSLSKPEADVSTPESEMIDDAHCEQKKDKDFSPRLAFSKPDVKISLADHGLDEKPAKEDSISGMDLQAKKLDTEVELPSVKLDAVISEAKEKESDIKFKKQKISFPKFGFSKSESRITDADPSLQKEGLSVPHTEIKETEVKIPAPDVAVEDKNKITTGSPSKFKLPTISLPKFDISISKTMEESNAKADDVTQSEIKEESEDASKNKTKLDNSEETATQDTEPSKLHFESQPVNAEIKTKDIDPESQGSRFMKPKFEFSFTKLKGPESQKGASKMEDNIDKMEDTPTHDMKMESLSIEGKEDLPGDAKETGIKLKVPKVLSSEQDIKSPEVNTDICDISITATADVKQPESDVKIQTTEMLKDHKSKGGSPIKFKLPTFKLPKFGSSASKTKPEITELSGEVLSLEAPVIDVNIVVKGTQVSGQETQTKMMNEALSVEMKGPHLATEGQSANVDLKVEDAELEGQGGKFKLPKFGIDIYQVEGSDLNTLKAGDTAAEAQEPDIKEPKMTTERKAHTTEHDLKGPDVMMALPHLGFSKPEVKTSEVNVNVQIDVPVPEGSVDIEDANVDINVSTVESDQKDSTFFGSPTKFKFPSINFSKFGVKSQKTALDINIKESEPEATNTKHSQPEVKLEVQRPKHTVQDDETERGADIPEVDSKGKGRVKRPSFSFPKFGFSKPDTTTPQLNDNIDVSIPEGTVHVTEQTAEMTLPGVVVEAEQKDPTIVVSPTIFKLPAVNLPKFGIKHPKATSDIPTVGADTEEPEISFPESGEVQTNIDIKVPSGDVDIMGKGTEIDGLGSKFKLPKFGIGMPKLKETEVEGKETKVETGPLSEEQVNVQKPDVAIEDVTIEMKADISDIDSKGLNVKLPKLGFSKPDIKSPEVDVSLPKTDLEMSMGIAEVSEQSAYIKSPEKEIVGSPTRFKLPTINFPKFGMKASKGTVDIPTANVDIKGPEFSLCDENNKKSSEVSSVDIKGLTANVEDASIEVNIKGEGIDIEQKDGKFKIPKFGIALPKIKGPDSDQGPEETQSEMPGVVLCIESKELNLSKELVEVDMEAKGTELEVEESKFKLPKLSLQKLKGPEIDINVSKAEDSQTEAKEAKPSKTDNVDADLTDMSSKGISVKMKKQSLAFPKIGFSKSDGKAQDIQAAETPADVSLPEGSTEIKVSEKDIKTPEGEIEITSPQFGSPTRFKLPTIKLPKFGVSTSKVIDKEPKDDAADIKETKVSSVDNKGETSKLDSSNVAEVEASSIDPKIKAKEINQEVQENKFKLPKFGISLPKVKGPELGVAAKEVKKGAPEIGITEPEMKSPAEVCLPTVDIASQEESASIQKTEVETEHKDNTIVTGSPSKFKLPAFKMPKFGISAQKTSDIKAEVAGVDESDTNTDLSIGDKAIQVQGSKAISRESEIEGTTEQNPEAAFKKVDMDKGSPSKFKLPSLKMPKRSMSKTKSQDGEDDTTIKTSAPDAKTEPKDDLQEPEKSPKFTMPSLGDVIRGFEVEFNVPTLEEMEAQKDKPSAKHDHESGVKDEASAEHRDKGIPEKSKFKFKFPKLGFSQSSDESDKLVDAKFEETDKHMKASTDQKTEVNKEQEKTEKGGWFSFSKFSPTKTAKTNEKEVIQPPKEAEKIEMNDDVEKESRKVNEEPEKSPLSEIVEENISPTLSLRSSEAFADISSTQTTEQVGLSQTSPTKVKVKYAEPTATAGVNDVNKEVVTSTARCELISMEPHQPERVNIPFSSDMSSPSVDTLKQMSGEIHVITSNIQAIPDTKQAAILSNLDVHGIHTSPLQVTLGSDSVLTVEETRVQSGEHTLVERHVVKETLSEETVLVTQRTRVFEGDSVEPISDETASSIRRLRDTVHTEKMKFFDSAETAEEVRLKSAEISIRHMDSSTDDNEGK